MNTAPLVSRPTYIEPSGYARTMLGWIGIARFHGQTVELREEERDDTSPSCC
jgi:hypothetical protein